LSAIDNISPVHTRWRARLGVGSRVLGLVGLWIVLGCGPKATEDSGNPSDTGEAWAGWSIDPDTLPAGDASCKEPLAAELDYVIDGDTAWLDTDEGELKVRFIGIDAPEIGYEGDPSECYGDEAKEYLDSWLKGQMVWLTFDADCQDDYGRWLAYLHYDETEDGFVQRRLLNEGYVTTMTIQPNDSFSETFVADENRARALSKGLWSACE